MTEAAHHFRYVASNRRVREDRRFVAGKGNFVADIDLPETRHVAPVTCREISVATLLCRSRIPLRSSS